MIETIRYHVERHPGLYTGIILPAAIGLAACSGTGDAAPAPATVTVTAEAPVAPGAMDAPQSNDAAPTPPAEEQPRPAQSFDEDWLPLSKRTAEAVCDKKKGGVLVKGTPGAGPEIDGQGKGEGWRIVKLLVDKDAIEPYLADQTGLAYADPASIDGEYMTLSEDVDLPPNPENSQQRAALMYVGKEDTCFAAIGVDEGGKTHVLPTQVDANVTQRDFELVPAA